MRTYVVTGSASGMGAATRRRLERQGHRVVGVDLADADVVADLSSDDGRAAMVDGVRSSVGDALSGVVACAGLSQSGAAAHIRGRIDNSDPVSIVRVNYFGVVATLAGLRDLLARGDRPRAAVIASIAVLRVDGGHPLVAACLAGDEARAVELAGAVDARAAYGLSKRAIARYVRREAPTRAWAGAGIALNAVAPALVRTPMAQPLLDDPTVDRDQWPMPLGGPAEAEHVAALLDWLTGADNERVTGQVVFADGGYEAVRQGDDPWRGLP